MVHLRPRRAPEFRKQGFVQSRNESGRSAAFPLGLEQLVGCQCYYLRSKTRIRELMP